MARSHGISAAGAIWDLQRALVEFVAAHWDEPDQGIWEMRGPPQRLVYSRVMAWVALDRAVQAVELYGLDGPVDEWRKVRAAIHDQVCTQGYNPELRSFTQAYGSKELDASLLLVPAVGFLPIDDDASGRHHRGGEAGPDGGRVRGEVQQQLWCRRFAGWRGHVPALLPVARLVLGAPWPR